MPTEIDGDTLRNLSYLLHISFKQRVGITEPTSWHHSKVYQNCAESAKNSANNFKTKREAAKNVIIVGDSIESGVDTTDKIEDEIKNVIESSKAIIKNV